MKLKLNHWSEVAITAVMRESEGSIPGQLDRDKARQAYSAGKKRTRRKVTEELLTEVADLYRDNIDNAAWRVIAERYGVSETTAGRYVLLARRSRSPTPNRPRQKKA